MDVLHRYCYTAALQLLSNCSVTVIATLQRYSYCHTVLRYSYCQPAVVQFLSHRSVTVIVTLQRYSYCHTGSLQLLLHCSVNLSVAMERYTVIVRLQRYSYYHTDTSHCHRFSVAIQRLVRLLFTLCYALGYHCRWWIEIMAA